MWKLIVCFIVLKLFQSGWQSIGDFKDYPVMIKTIKTQIQNADSSKDSPDSISMNLSYKLNDLFSKFWNVLIFQTKQQAKADVLFIGHSFKDHYVWFDGYGKRNFSYVIWKQEKCWINFQLIVQGSSGMQKNLNKKMRDVYQVISNKTLRQSIFLPIATPVPNAYDNALRLQLFLNYHFEGVYTVVIGQNVKRYSAFLCTYNQARYLGPNFVTDTFNYGPITYTVLILGMRPQSQLYQGLKQSQKYVPQCLSGFHRIKQIPYCSQTIYFSQYKRIYNNVEMSFYIFSTFKPNKQVSKNQILSFRGVPYDAALKYKLIAVEVYQLNLQNDASNKKKQYIQAYRLSNQIEDPLQNPNIVFFLYRQFVQGTKRIKMFRYKYNTNKIFFAFDIKQITLLIYDKKQNWIESQQVLYAFPL